MDKTYIPYLITAVAMVFLIRRTLRSRTVRIETMWIIPVLLIAIAVLVIVQAPPREPVGVAALVISALAGAALGWQRGRFTHITIDQGTGALTSKGSVWGLVLVLGLFVIRQAVRTWAMSQPRHSEIAIVVADAATVLGFATVIVARLEMYLRCRKLLANGGVAA